MVKRNVRVDWSAILLQEGPQGVLCIRKPNQDHWQFPGGKRKSNDRRPEITAVRENREETGIRLPLMSVTLVGRTHEFNHATHNPWLMYFYQARLTDAQVASHFAISREGEEVGVFTWAELNAMRNFSPFHRMLAERHGVWKKK